VPAAGDWNPKIEERDHPQGEQGIRSSLEEVAKKAAEGSRDPRVRAWAIESLERGRREGVKVNNERGRAEVILSAVQKKLWVPDPVGTEFMAGAHLTACVDKKAPCFHGGDCDDLCVLLGACFLSVGLHTMIVGHAYNTQRNIQHVLTAVRASKNWYYADPSTNFPLGKCEPFTRERILSVPNVQVICDERACLTNPASFDPDEKNFVDRGYFVGVDGVPERRIAWLGVGVRCGR
jgi:hypothetical protein